MSYILIVDDDADLAQTIAKVLSVGGHETRIELDPKSGLKSIGQRKPDLVILDVMFPEDTSAGFDLARTIRREEAYQSLPILMLTAVNSKYPFGFSASDIDEQWLPVSEFLEKPVDFDVLNGKINDLLQRSGV